MIVLDCLCDDTFYDPSLYFEMLVMFAWIKSVGKDTASVTK